MGEDALRGSPYGPADFPYTEKSAAHFLGLNKDEAREARRRFLKEGLDFTIHKKALWLSQGGFEKLRDALRGNGAGTCGGSTGEGGAGVKNDLEKKAAGPVVAAVERLVLARVEMPNGRMVMAVREGDDFRNPKVLVRLRVQRKEALRRGMVLECRLVAGYTDLYDLAQAMPRRPVLPEQYGGAR